jgi:RNAse (barnase) inhibitor barstar
MYGAGAFEYSSKDFARDHVVVSGSEITSRNELFRILANKLAFPEYFGENWDALIDCLSDLSWMDRDTVVLAHATLPALDQQTLRIYLECLQDVLGRRRDTDRPFLRILFREVDRPALERLFAATSPGS